jgi:hypothetical protein
VLFHVQKVLDSDHDESFKALVAPATNGVIFLGFSQNSLLSHLSLELCAGFSGSEPFISCLERQVSRMNQVLQTLTGTLHFVVPIFVPFEITIGNHLLFASSYSI